MEDLESGSTKTTVTRHRTMIREAATRNKVWCNFCKLEVDHDSYHCDECDVCIEEYDHHCVFFSKCIGGGNIYCFWGALGGVLANFINIGIMLVITASIHGSLREAGD